MHKRLLLICLCLALAASCCPAHAENTEFSVVPALLRPGKTERISFIVPADDQAEMSVFDEDGEKLFSIRENLPVAAGENHLTWDGMDAAGKAVAEGAYELRLITRENGEAAASLRIGPESPQILALSAPGQVSHGDVWELNVKTNMPGTILCRIKLDDHEWHPFLEAEVPAGESRHYWNGAVDGQGIEEGDYFIQIRLTDETGFAGMAQQLAFSVTKANENTPQEEPQETALETPAPGNTPEPVMHTVIPSAVTTQADENSYWTLPVGEMNEQAIWDVMMQPIVVIDGHQQEVYRLRKTPNNSSKAENIVGEITYASQGLHILETRDDGWTLVEAFNSSYGPDCKSRRGYGVTDDLIQGYVKTSLLKTITPRTDYALLVDKLEQKMYIFSEGKCIGSLLVSTGLNNEKQSWNETPSGEYLMVSRMGGFPAGNLWCNYGMRINGGCAMHEVPYIGNAETPSNRRDYSSTVPLLGKKASHGCIRIQKAANENGQNIKWLWDNIKVNTKVLIWDDTGRYLAYPDDDTEVYYNPNGGKNYHENQYCPAVKDRYLPLTAITYQELNTAYNHLTPCATCAQLMKKAEIDQINRQNGFQ